MGPGWFYLDNVGTGWFYLDNVGMYRGGLSQTSALPTKSNFFFFTICVLIKSTLRWILCLKVS